MAATLRSLGIKTRTCRRAVRELRSYEEEVEKESEEAHQADPAPTGFAMVDAQSSRWPRRRRQRSSMPFFTPEEEPEVRPAANDHNDGGPDINFIHISNEKDE